MGAGKVGHRKIVDKANDAILLANQCLDFTRAQGTAIETIDVKVKDLRTALAYQGSKTDKLAGEQRLYVDARDKETNERIDQVGRDAVERDNGTRKMCHRVISSQALAMSSFKYLTFRQRLAWLFLGRLPINQAAHVESKYNPLDPPTDSATGELL